jgi:hypothetical protein
MSFKIALRIAALSFALLAGVSIAGAVEKPVAPEHNPPGDIPDTQVFVVYSSPGGFSIKMPEGWSRTDGAQSVRFADKYNTIDLAAAPRDVNLTVDWVKANELPVLEKTGRAIKVVKVKAMNLKGGPAVLVSYTSNSEPSAVTNKQVRLEHNRYLFSKDGKLATLDLAAPQGADNVDDWLLMANSFRWK